MANLLTKDKKITYYPGSPGVPAYSGQAWMPARTAQEQQTVCGYQTTVAYSSGTTMAWVEVPPNPATGYAGGYEYMLVDSATGLPTSGSTSYSATYVCTTQTVTVYYPEQPYIAPTEAIAPVESQTLIDLNLGWNAGARSVGFLLNSGRVEFKVYQGVIGAVVGLNDEDVDAGYTSIDFAWYFSSGVARVYENGVEAFYSGAYVTGDVFAVERVNGVVRYLKNGTPVYTSSNYSYGGSMFMDASLYAGDDAVYDPVIINYGMSAVSMEPLAGAARGSVRVLMSGADVAFEPLQSAGGRSETTYGQGSNAVLRPLTGAAMGSAYTRVGSSATSMLPLKTFSRAAVRSNNAMQPLVGLGANKIYGDARVSLKAMTTFAQGGMPMPRFAIANNAMLYLTGGATGLTGEIGGSDASMGALVGLASGDDSLETLKSYGQSVVSLAPLQGYASAYEGNTNATLWNVMGGIPLLTVFREVLVVMNEHLNVASVFAVQLLRDADAMSGLSVANTYATQTELEAVLRSVVLAGFNVPVFDQASQVWALNTKTGASSQYEHFDFNSFGKLGGNYYGCKPDGLYLLAGEDDNGLPIRASLNLGLKDFDTSAMKRVPNAYVGVATDGTMILKVAVGDEVYYYNARAGDPKLRTQRFDIGKGLRGNYFEFELFNSDGCDFDLSRIEFFAVTLDRRI